MNPGVAVVVDEPGSARLADTAPRAPGRGEVLVRVHACGLCGSDRELFAGTRPAEYVRYPVTPGHEWAGVVEAVGDDADPSLAGRKVVGEGFRNCQTCARCRDGDPTLCTAGYDETGFTRPGAMADTLTLPARLLHVLPDDADLHAAALLEPAACGAAAVLAAQVQPGDRVAVVGDGALGLTALQLLAASSPAELLVIGGGTERAAVARELGADSFRTKDEPVDDVAGRMDVVVETAGASASARTSAELLRRGGRLVLTGIPPEGAAGLDPTDLVVRRLDVRTVFGAPPRAWSHAVRAFALGLLRTEPLITHRRPLAEFADAIALVGSGDPAVGKVLLIP
ncbi:zinc-dependent alcohol dehydrogenase [Prauserella rugosa]|uniref:Threonine dehydrogenase-like Zn-dependent dehydrogenase n=1 Tax=Prauserella rugosa TaxID=43354 RepID=A0A660CD79_9PSEU|nr:alcohol dehydrogenase catalytic domain-containing protein [Prauserella rugosa]KID28074.1 theronine dehydrogenase-like Zn-dependent dehydrogenase [Prauserella sp. Am3]KMS83077.1 dehydrogenase [Streptomyces regensis]TWH19877.1 threonine dehydrogenase-like Zn-dependent dehydrogenase [Prauserella rugosa]